jgi:hypothetical protein
VLHRDRSALLASFADCLAQVRCTIGYLAPMAADYHFLSTGGCSIDYRGEGLGDGGVGVNRLAAGWVAVAV